MMYFRACFFCVCALVLACSGPSQAAPAQREATPLVITIPAPTLAQVLTAALPFPIQPAGGHLLGSLMVESISDLHLQQNRIDLTATVVGQDLRLETEVAGQRLNLKLGNARLVLPITLELRFDPARQVLFVTPRVAESQNSRPGDPGAALGQAISGLSGKEYPVPLHDLRPFSAQVGERQLNLAWTVRELVADNEQLLLRLLPRVSKGK